MWQLLVGPIRLLHWAWVGKKVGKDSTFCPRDQIVIRLALPVRPLPPPARSTSARPASGVPSGGCCTKRTSAAVSALHRGPLGCSNRCRGCPCMESSSASSCGPVSWPSCHRLSADGTKPEVRQRIHFWTAGVKAAGRTVLWGLQKKVQPVVWGPWSEAVSPLEERHRCGRVAGR